MVGARDAHQRRSRSQEGRVQPERSQTNRGLFETVGRAEHAEEIHFISIRAFHAHILHQSSRQEFIGRPAKDVAASKGRASKAIQANMISSLKLSAANRRRAIRREPEKAAADVF
jgi:hypothetical protein